MTKLYQRIASAIMLTTFAASVLTGCSSAPASSSQSSSDAPAVEFGLGLDSKGFYDGIKAQDYVTLPDDYAAIPLSEEDVAANEEGYGDFLEYIVQAAGTTTEVTDRAIQKGDMVTLDLTSSVDGVNLEDGTLQDYTVILGYGTFIEGFEEQLLGHKSGETFDVSIEYPDDAGTAKDVDGNEVDLSGKSVLFSVTVKSVMEYELTDEAIVKAFGDTTTMPDGTPVTTVDQLYDYYIESETMTNTQNAIIAYLQENSEVSEIPESIVEQQKEVERQYAEYIASVYNYESVEEFLAANDYEDMDAYIDTAMDSIESNVKYRLIIQAIAEADGLEVENDAYVKAFGATKDIVAATYGEEYAAQMALEYTVLPHLMSTAKVS